LHFPQSGPVVLCSHSHVSLLLSYTHIVAWRLHLHLGREETKSSPSVKLALVVSFMGCGSHSAVLKCNTETFVKCWFAGSAQRIFPTNNFCGRGELLWCSLSSPYALRKPDTSPLNEGLKLSSDNCAAKSGVFLRVSKTLPLVISFSVKLSNLWQCHLSSSSFKEQCYLLFFLQIIKTVLICLNTEKTIKRICYSVLLCRPDIF
jgi:hypothetical protein